MRVRPYDWVVEHAQRHVLAGLTVLLVCSSASLAYMDRALVTTVAPNGIVSFELVGSLEGSEAILRSWSQQARSAALLIQGFDYLYLLVYPAWLSLAAVRLSAPLGEPLRRLGSATSWIVLLAAPLDAVENYALIQQLLHGANAAQAQLALWCAVPKFVLVAAAAAYLVVATGARLARPRGSDPNA